MNRKQILVLFAVVLTACSGSDADENSPNNGENAQNNANAENNENNANNENNLNNAHNAQNNVVEDQDTGTDVGDGVDVVVDGVGLTQIFESAFVQTGCVAGYCHGGAVDGLVLNTAGVSIDAMVGVDSIRPSCGLTKLVVPGKPEESLLWLRVRPESLDDEECVNKMPKGTTGLDDETADLIYAWILDGAQL